MLAACLNKADNLLEAINGIISKFATVIIIALMAGMGLVIGAHVFLRFFFASGIYWSEELARCFLIWISFLGAALAYPKGEHIAVTVFVDYLSPKNQKVVILLAQIVMVLFVGCLIIYGSSLTFNNFERHQISPALQVPIWLIYLAVPVGSSAIMLQVLQRIIKLAKELN